MKKENINYSAPAVVCLLLIAVLIFLPTGYEGAVQYKEAERCIAEVTAADNSAIVDTGLVRSGEQRCRVTFCNGLFRGKTATAVNLLQGSLEQDKLFSEGDKALVVISHDAGTIRRVTMIDHFRVPGELLLAGLFFAFLILFAGRTGIRAILSFTVTVLAIWKLLIPAYLNGSNPIWIGLLINLLLTTLIIALVYGFDRRCLAAVGGSFLGILVTCGLGIFVYRPVSNSWGSHGLLREPSVCRVPASEFNADFYGLHFPWLLRRGHGSVGGHYLRCL